MQFTREGTEALYTWTHEALDLLFNHARTVPEALLDTPVRGFGHDTILKQLRHLVAIEGGWLSDLQGRQDQTAGTWQTLPDIAFAKRATMRQTIEYLRALSEQQLNDPMPRIPPTWAGPNRSPGFILHHLVTHAFHHKGQIVAMFRLLGHPAPDTDLQHEVS